MPFLLDGTIPPSLPDDGLDRVPGYGMMEFAGPWDRRQFAEELVLGQHHPDGYLHRLHLLPPSLDPPRCVGPGCAGRKRWPCNPASWALGVLGDDRRAAA
ncbi:hypothetical protein [Plantactinospora alkalitolerans]|uniref:hypothetical protein n=1 Tax=Plantactinospora alkalitolerans TaxID=2789879 RepID=UPI0018ACBF6E|nr:hypothetical protein [Plantactinospora alkalitolerans]